MNKKVIIFGKHQLASLAKYYLENDTNHQIIGFFSL